MLLSGLRISDSQGRPFVPAMPDNPEQIIHGPNESVSGPEYQALSYASPRRGTMQMKSNGSVPVFLKLWASLSLI